MMKFARSYSVTPVGGFLLAILAAAVALAVVGPRSVQTPSFVGAILIALLILGGWSSGRGRVSTENLEERRADFGADPRRLPDQPEPAAEAEAWEHERQRRGMS